MAGAKNNKIWNLGLMDSQKEAVNIGINLSSQLINASLSIMAIIGAVAVFIIDSRNINWIFYVLIGLGIFSFISSVVLGSKGIDTARKDGFNDNWNLINTKSFFNLQAIFCFLGIIFSISSLFFGKEKESRTEVELVKLNKYLETQSQKHQKQLDILELEVEKLREALHSTRGHKSDSTY